MSVGESDLGKVGERTGLGAAAATRVASSGSPPKDGQYIRNAQYVAELRGPRPEVVACACSFDRCPDGADLALGPLVD